MPDLDDLGRRVARLELALRMILDSLTLASIPGGARAEPATVVVGPCEYREITAFDVVSS